VQLAACFSFKETRFLKAPVWQSLLKKSIISSALSKGEMKLQGLLWLHRPTASEADVDGMAIEVEPSHQYSIPCCCCVTDGRRGAVWQNGIWHGSVHETKMWHRIPPCGKNCTHWHSSVLRDQTVSFFTNMAYRLLSSAGKNPELMAMTALRTVFCHWEFAVSNSVLVLYLLYSPSK